MATVLLVGDGNHSRRRIHKSDPLKAQVKWKLGKPVSNENAGPGCKDHYIHIHTIEILVLRILWYYHSSTITTLDDTGAGPLAPTTWSCPHYCVVRCRKTLDPEIQRNPSEERSWDEDDD